MHDADRTSDVTTDVPKGEYILPLLRHDQADEAELVDYLRGLLPQVDVTVVDGSDAALFDALAAALPPQVRHLPPRHPGANGKVRGVLTGVDAARHERLILADDDVRYDTVTLDEVLARLGTAHLVRPQNVFFPSPWHTRIDTARMLIGRAFGGDFGGTTGVRRSTLVLTGGYRADVLFENLELERTVRSRGGRVDVARDLFVRRIPPTTAHFWRQRVRQAYDDFAQPVRLVVELAIVPVLIAACTLRAWRVVASVPLASIALAEAGRRVARGRTVFPATSALWAPVWMLERGIAVWMAVGARLRGGVRYSGTRVRVAASRTAAIRRRARPAVVDDVQGVNPGG